MKHELVTEKCMCIFFLQLGQESFCIYLINKVFIENDTAI